MRKILFILLLLLVLIGCSKKEQTIHDVFEPYEGVTFFAVDNLGSQSLRDMEIFEDVLIYELFKYENGNIIEVTFYGNDSDGEFYTFEQFQEGNDIIHTNILGYTEALAEKYTLIPGTDFFLESTYKDFYDGKVPSFYKVYRFSEDGDKLEAYSVYEIADIGIFDEIPFEDLNEILKDADISKHPITDLFIDFKQDIHLVIDFYKNVEVKSSSYSLGDKFEFNKLEISIGSVLGWNKVDNSFSDLNQKDVFLLDFEITNLSSDLHGFNMFHYNIYTPQGNRNPSVTAYFDNTIDFTGKLLKGGSTKAVLPVLYTEDGEYTIIFDNSSERIVVKFEIKK